MKNSTNQKNDSTSTKLSHKLSYIFWAIINNNLISTFSYLILKTIEFIILSLMILSIYGQVKSANFSTTVIEEFFELHQYEKLNYISELIIISYIAILAFCIIILLSTKQQKGYYQEKTFFLRSISVMVNLFRAILNTIIAIIFSCNFLDYDPESFTTRLVQLLSIAFMGIFTIILVVIVSNFSILRIPNQMLPWSEQSAQPFILEFAFKISLSMTFNFRKDPVLRHAFVVISILIMTYKIYLRITFSSLFKEIVHKTELILDNLLLNYIFLSLVAEPFQDREYIIKSTIIAPLWLIIVWYIDYYYQRKRLMDFADNLKTDNQKIFTLTKLLQAFVNNKCIDQNILSQIKFSHYVQCQPFAQNLDQFMIKSIKLKENSSANPENEEVKNNDDPISFNTLVLNFPEEEEKKGLGSVYETIELKRTQFNNTNQYSNIMSYHTEENLKPLSNIEYIEKNLQKKKQKQNFVHAKTKKSSLNINPYNIFTTSTISLKNQGSFNQHEQEVISKKKRFKSLLKHFFKYHMINEQSKDMRLFILRAYFTLKVLKNHYLAHFLVYNLQQLIKNENFIQKCIIMIHINHFHFKINQKMERSNTFNNVNLKNVLGLSQLMAKFEEYLDVVSEHISQFWQSFIHDKQAKTLYQQGLKISQDIETISKTYEEIEKLQGEQKEMKVYVLMSGFYKYVVFKTNEYIQEMNKSRMVWQTKKVAQQSRSKVNDSEKGLLIAKIDLKKPMKIEFINKYFSKLLQCDSKELVNKKINTIMPQYISENHHKFVDKFLETGRFRMMNTRKENFIRNKQGYIIPVITYLNINNQSLQNLILIVEENQEFRVFDKDTETNQYSLNESIILADKTFRVYEMNEIAYQILRISPELIESYKQGTGFEARIDDFFTASNSFQDIRIQYENGHNEFEVSIKLDYQKDLELVSDKHQNIFRQKGEMSQEQSSLASNYLNRLLHTTFIMKIQTVQYVDSQFEMKIIAIQPLQMNLDLIMASNLSKKHASINQSSKMTGGFAPQMSLEDSQYADLGKDEKTNNGLGGIQKFFAQLSKDGSFDLSSQGSSTSSSSNSLISKYSQYSQSLKNKKIPMTLKFVLQIVVIAFVLIVGTSTVSLTLTLSNFNDALKGIKVSYQSFQRLNAITQTRLKIRLLYNIANGYVPSQSNLIGDRFTYYAKAVKENMELIRTEQVLLAETDKEIEDQGGFIDLEFLKQDNTIEHQTRQSNQAVNIYITYGDDLTTQVLQNGREILKSQLSYFVVENVDVHQASLIERMGYFLIQNGNQDFYHKFLMTTFDYTKNKKQSMENKIYFSSVMTWICIAIIFICGLIVLPLSGRIQNRILILMTIFFEVKRDLKIKMITEINKFKDMLKPEFQNKQNKSSKIRMLPLEFSVNQILHDIPSIQQKNQIEENKEYPSSVLFQKMAKKMKYSGQRQGEKNSETTFEITPEFKQNREQTFGIIPIKGKKNKRISKKRSIEDQNEDFDEEEEKEEEDLHKVANDPQETNKSLEEVKNENDLQVNKQEGNTNLMRYFVQQIQKAKLRQSLIIMLITLTFNSYFLGTYFMTTQDFETLVKGLDVIYIILLRKACVENALHSIQEQLIINATYLVQDNDNNFQNITDYYIDYCYSVETLFQEKILSDQPDFLKDAFDYMEQLEQGQFCDFFDNSNHSYEINSTQCYNHGNGMAKHGATGVYQSIYKDVTQIKFDYQSAQQSGLIRNKTYIINLVSKLTDYMDGILIIFDHPDQNLCNQASNSLMDYYNTEYMQIILIFAIFTTVTIIFMLIFLLSKYFRIQSSFLDVFKRLKREMLLSNHLLMIIDFENITEEERKNINIFLTKY